jgi:hypothetical protein
LAPLRCRVIFGAGWLAPVSSAVINSASLQNRPLPAWVKKLHDLCNQTWQQYPDVHGWGEKNIDMEMLNSIHIYLDRLDQQIQHLVEYCHSEMRAIEEKLDNVQQECEIFIQHVETT